MKGGIHPEGDGVGDMLSDGSGDRAAEKAAIQAADGSHGYQGCCWVVDDRRQIGGRRKYAFLKSLSDELGTSGVTWLLRHVSQREGGKGHLWHFAAMPCRRNPQTGSCVPFYCTLQAKKKNAH